MNKKTGRPLAKKNISRNYKKTRSVPHFYLVFVARLFLFLSVVTALHIPQSFAKKEISLSKKDGGSPTPLTLYGDWSSDKCRSTVIMSHGLGGSHEAFSPYAKAMAKAGYRIVIMDHGEKDRGHILRVLFKSDPGSVLREEKRWNRRFQDLDATYRFATRYCRPEKLILAGHSMGAAIAMLEAGAKGLVNYGGQDRFDAYIALSPQGIGWIFESGAWEGIKKPVLMITGTKDKTLGKSYKTRLEAFTQMPNGHKRLVVIGGADHLNIGGRANEQTQNLIANIIIEFLEDYRLTPLPESQYATQAQITDK